MRLKALHYVTKQPIEIEIEQGLIVRILEDEAEAAERDQLPYAAPGLVDLQINGYAGYDFNLQSLTADVVDDAVRALWQAGVTSLYPTVVSNSPESIHAAMEAIREACERDAGIASCIPGVHLEGPFISPQDGARGAHAKAFVRAPDWELFCQWQEASGGRIAILTMSPEWEGSGAFIRRCTDSGVTVSIGHTSATPEQIQEAVSQGARMTTHFGNGVHLSLPRHPNYLWEQLAQDELWTCVIADGFHLPDQVLKVVRKVKQARMLLVSDAVYLSGLPAGEYTTSIGGRVVLSPEGRLYLAEQERLLAGSAQMLLQGIEQLAGRGIAERSEAWNMASIGPAGFMGLPSAAGLTAGAPADFVLFKEDQGKLMVECTYKAGAPVYSAI